MKRIITYFFIYSLFILCEELTGYEIMEKVKEQSQKNKTKYFSILMKIVDEQGSERERFFNLWEKKYDDDDTKRSLIRFFKPSSVKKTALLTKKEDDEKNQWIYLPSQKVIKRLSSDDKRKSFMGSDFTNADISGRELDEDEHKLVKTTEEQYVILSIPKSEEDSYSKIYSFVDKERFIIDKIIFFDKDKKLLKVLENRKFTKKNDEFICINSFMDNKQTGGKTILEIQEVELGVEIDDSTLSIKGLRQ